uniref:Transposase n=1 Tax=Heterorhabditis bacteriophora TaxID=37862 RepID=A0A1I7WEN9_HETBA
MSFSRYCNQADAVDVAHLNRHERVAATHGVSPMCLLVWISQRACSPRRTTRLYEHPRTKFDCIYIYDESTF